MGRHQHAKVETLSQVEIGRFITAATELHEACCRPHLKVNSEHQRALTDLNTAIWVAIYKVTGDNPHWMRGMPGKPPGC